MIRVIGYSLVNLTIGAAGIYAMIVVFGIWLTLLMSFVAVASQYARGRMPPAHRLRTPFN